MLAYEYTSAANNQLLLGLCDESTSWNQLRKQVKQYNIY